MPTGPFDHLEHDFAFSTIEEARDDTHSPHNLSPPDDDYHELCGEENHKSLVYDIYHAIIAHAKRNNPTSTRSPDPPDIDPETWREFQIDQEENLRRILGKEETGQIEVERRCWIMIDQVLEIHRTGARSANFFGPAEKWVLKFSERLERVVKAVEDHSIIAVDVVRGHNLAEIAIMTAAFVEKRVELQFEIFLQEKGMGEARRVKGS
ncbi:hypothetical protein AC579_3111 [Pseudocercospora musae]|uniref:Uncharacterized protein n=1 Tax=Pseudocercospora musae TaxID=113226 RepID=A0A139H5Y1_9PEZI|nr:hypothetical protein AC579_3111 [Pseudocercospora musae]